MRLMQWVVAAMAVIMFGGPLDSARAQAKAAPGAVEQEIATKLQGVFGRSPDSVKRTPYGLFEVVFGTDIFYTDQSAAYVIAAQPPRGGLIDTKTRENVTQARLDELMKVDFAKLPLDQAVRLRVGKGTRQFVTFEDPNCPYCRKLHNDIQGMKDVTVHVFLYPILSPDSREKAKNIWCAKDRAAAWNAAMIEGKTPPAAAADCKHPLDQNLQLGQRLGVSGTPTLIFQDGSRMPGASSADEIEKRLVSVKK
jgi:thiol:disulfide interchange protein DsbC